MSDFFYKVVNLVYYLFGKRSADRLTSRDLQMSPLLLLASLMFGVVNHGLIETDRSYLLSKSPGGRMVRTGIVSYGMV